MSTLVTCQRISPKRSCVKISASSDQSTQSKLFARRTSHLSISFQSVTLSRQLLNFRKSQNGSHLDEFTTARIDALMFPRPSSKMQPNTWVSHQDTHTF